MDEKTKERVADAVYREMADMDKTRRATTATGIVAGIVAGLEAALEERESVPEFEQAEGVERRSSLDTPTTPMTSELRGATEALTRILDAWDYSAKQYDVANTSTDVDERFYIKLMADKGVLDAIKGVVNDVRSGKLPLRDRPTAHGLDSERRNT